LFYFLFIYELTYRWPIKYLVAIFNTKNDNIPKKQYTREMETFAAFI